jgi:hypothetical protein
MKKYLLCPSAVTSKTDGDRHKISASDLSRLYNVPMSECVVRPEYGSPAHHGWNENHGLIELWPRYDGDYALPHNG